jgi:hypothetical protein
LHAFHQLLDRLRLVAGRRIGHEQLEGRAGIGDEFALFSFLLGLCSAWGIALIRESTSYDPLKLRAAGQRTTGRQFLPPTL